MLDKGDGKGGGVTCMVGLPGCGVLREGVGGVVGKNGGSKPYPRIY